MNMHHVNFLGPGDLGGSQGSYQVFAQLVIRPVVLI